MIKFSASKGNIASGVPSRSSNTLSFSAENPSSFYPLCRGLCEQRIHAVKQMLRECLAQECWANSGHPTTVCLIKNTPPGSRKRGHQLTNSMHALVPAAPALALSTQPFSPLSIICRVQWGFLVII